MKSAAAGSARSAITSTLYFPAFEVISRPLLVAEAREIDFPLEVLLLSLRMYARPRRLVYRQCVSEALSPARGVAAGSATADAAGTAGRQAAGSPTELSAHAGAVSATWRFLSVQLEDDTCIGVQASRVRGAVCAAESKVECLPAD